VPEMAAPGYEGSKDYSAQDLLDAAIASSTACLGAMPLVTTLWTALPQTCSSKIRVDRHSLSRTPIPLIRCGRSLAPSVKPLARNVKHKTWTGAISGPLG
jgi:hypothetical protein